MFVWCCVGSLFPRLDVVRCSLFLVCCVTFEVCAACRCYALFVICCVSCVVCRVGFVVVNWCFLLFQLGVCCCCVLFVVF